MGYKEELEVLSTTHDLPYYFKSDVKLKESFLHDLDNIEDTYTFALILYLDTKEEKHLEAMGNYLKNKNKHTKDKLTIPSAKDKWWSSEKDILNNLSVKSRALNEFFKIDKETRETM